MKWHEIVGNYYEVGYQLGKWWGKHFVELIRIEPNYKEWLKKGWRDELFPLFRNVLLHYPEIIEEIRGMAKGISDAGFETTIPAIFALCLGETDPDPKDDPCACAPSSH